MENNRTHMKNIAVINMYGVLPWESGYSRSHYISKYLAEAGFKVDFIVGSFNHFAKQQKVQSHDTSLLPYNVIELSNPSYTKNVSFARWKSIGVFAKNLGLFLKNHNTTYDCIINMIPPAEVGLKCINYCKGHNIPYIIDLNDLWPEAMKMAIKNKVLWYIFTTPIRIAANKVYKAADGIIGTSNTYTNRPLEVNKKNPLTATVYVGTDIDAFDKGAKENDEIVIKNKNEFWVTYAGTLGTSYDIHTLMKAGGILKQRGYKDIKIMILGDGPLRNAFEETGKQCGCNCVYTGYTKYECMAAYLKKSDILINSFVRKAPQSIVNKIGDYLSAGKPMINTCSDQEFRDMVERLNFGENVIAEDEVALANLIEKMYNDSVLRIKYGTNARKIAEIEFDRKIAYQKIVKLVKELLQK